MKSKYKFKVGDVVIVVNDSLYEGHPYYPVKKGQVAVVLRLNEFGNSYYLADFHTSGSYREEDLEFSIIHDSPLMKALS